MEHIELTITGMSCDHCARAVARALSRQPGTTVEQVTAGSARVAYDPAVVTPVQLVAAVEEEGYGAVPRGVS
jgi:copper chaperone